MAAAVGGGGEPEGGEGGAADAAGAAVRSRRLIKQTISEQAETGVSRSLRTQAEGDLFCLSAIVSTDQQLDEESLAREIAKLEKKHRVTLKLAWLADDTD